MHDILQPHAPVPDTACVAHGVTLTTIPEGETFSLAALSGCEETLQESIHALFGVCLPVTPRFIQNSEGIVFLWAGPCQWMVSAPTGVNLAERLSPCRASAAVTSQSSSRIRLSLSGRGAGSIAAKLVPIDLHPRVFGPGDVALTLAGHIPVILRQTDMTPSYEFLVFRSLARSLHHDIHVAMLGGIPHAERIP